VHVNRGLVFWGVALITAGAVALAIQSGAIDDATAREAWRFWPVVLIVIGLAVIAARTPFALAVTVAAGLVVGGMAGSFAAGWPDGISVGCGGEPDQQMSDDGQLDASASVNLDFNCGELAVGLQDGNAWSLDARHASGEEPKVEANPNSLTIRAPSGGFGFANARQEWDLTLPGDQDLDLEIDANAASSRLDLEGGSLSRLSLDANAGDVRLTLDGATIDRADVSANAGSLSVTVDADTSFDGSFGMNAGSLKLCAAEGTNIEITVSDTNITFSHNLDDSGLSRSGDTWRSSSGTPDIRISVEGNAASFTYNPDGGCSS
jgi:hypothetical protein